MKRVKTKRHVIFIVACLFYCGSVPAQTVEEVLATYYSKVSPDGNVKRWGDIKSCYLESHGYFIGSTFQKQVNLLEKFEMTYHKTYRVWPDKQKDELYSDSLFTDMQSRFYFVNRRNVMDMRGMPGRQETELNSVVYFNFPTMMVIERIRKSKTVTYNGVVNVPGVSKPCHEIGLDPEQQRGEAEKLFFSVSSGLLEATLNAAGVYTVYANYKNVEGYLIPVEWKGLNNMGLFSFTEYDVIDLNAEIPVRKFEYKKDTDFGYMPVRR